MIGKSSNREKIEQCAKVRLTDRLDEMIKGARQRDRRPEKKNKTSRLVDERRKKKKLELRD